MPTKFPEEPLDVLGSYSLEAKQPHLAVRLFRENIDRYPRSSNAHESLGEGLVAVGDTTAAVAQFNTAVTLSKVVVQDSPPRSSYGPTSETSLPRPWSRLHALHKDTASAAK